MTLKRVASAAALCMLAAGMATPSLAQTGFTADYMDIGPTIGLGGIGSASTAFGGRWEKGIKPLPEFGDGILGVQVGATYYSWSSVGYSWTYIPIGVTANYHFKIDNEKLDPFLGAGLGYQILSCSWPGVGPNACGNSTIYFIGRAGARYFFAPKMAMYADAGAGGATLNVGLMFRLK